MQKTLDALKWGFISVFALIVVGIWTYEIGWVRPRERCEAAHRWWSEPDRKCAIPVSLSTFTGRPNRPPATP